MYAINSLQLYILNFIEKKETQTATISVAEMGCSKCEAAVWETGGVSQWEKTFQEKPREQVSMVT